MPEISVEPDPVPEEANVEMSVTIRRQFSADRPARIRVALQNLADEPQQLSFGSSPPFDEYVGEQIRERDQTDGTAEADDPAALLVPDDMERVAIVDESGGKAEYVVPTTPTAGCWQAVNEIAGADVLERIELDPNESLSETYTVVAHSDNENCLPEGEYRFESADYLPDGSSWGFTLVVSESAGTTTR